ncbi:hypothetical protein E0493_20875 [Roseomonas sp. M0104]|uniref:Uncharacterized protein n=1 Tax=Teichococcus coralli TaxID=2545983 RepID=A0A845BKK9_9PROT|nr:hypothetical protein [Pseudoroseomonas coralli]MXP65807.1 hypothetical protein [Pseudoroseomonas coralli]
MIVYGDAVRHEEPHALLGALQEGLRQLSGLPPGLARHTALVARFIEAGELAQGLADAAFRARGEDAASAQGDAGTALLTRLAAALRASWSSGFQDLPPLPEAFLPGPLPEVIAPKRMEGFSFYALYPEGYLQAAEKAGLGEATVVIGLRSIGLPLAALVAAALGAAPPVSLRPVGHPFERRLALSGEIKAALLRGQGPRAIVDEGPGLSGSSMGAVADLLEGGGIAPSRLHFFPSHGGAPGPQASARHRARWSAAARHLCDFERLVLHASRPAHRLEHWAADLTGPPEAPLRELSGGAWRALRYAAEGAWPPANPQQERRKFLLQAGGRPWLLKFTGLGPEGEGKARMGRMLSEAGLVPSLAGYRHGFLVAGWEAAARGLDQAPRPPAALLAPVARYLAFRRRHFAKGSGGASLAALWDMACHNTAEALGEPAARALRRLQPDLPRLEARLRPIAGDNRLHPWEWLALPDGRLLKADALDHHAAHDLIGCQDLAWDLVGAEVELGLAPTALAAAVARESGHATDPALPDAYRPCYLAFQLGAAGMAAAACQGMPEEAARLRAATRRYTVLLRRLIEAG